MSSLHPPKPSLKTRYDTFVFDLDGTLLDSRRDIAAAANATLAHLEVTQLSESEVAALVGHGVRQLMVDILNASGQIPGHDVVEKALSYFMNYYERHATVATLFYPGVADSIRTLSGKKLAVLTNKPEPLSIKILTALGYGDTFFPILGATEARLLKPHPDGLLLIMEQLQTVPERTLMIGDSTIDVQTAHAARCDSLVLLSGLGQEADLRAAAPTWVAHDFVAFQAML